MSTDDLPIPPDLAWPGDHPPLGDNLLRLVDDDPAAAILNVASEPWHIDDDNVAQWALAHVATIDAEHAELEAQAEAWAEKIAAWFTHRAKPLTNRRAFFVAHLERYALEQREATGRKTLTLPSGKVTTRETKPTVAVDEEHVFLAWALADPDRRTRFVRTTQAPIAATVAKLVVVADRLRDVVVTDDGEVVPGVYVRPGETTAKVVPGA